MVCSGVSAGPAAGKPIPKAEGRTGGPSSESTTTHSTGQVCSSMEQLSQHEPKTPVTSDGERNSGAKGPEDKVAASGRA